MNPQDRDPHRDATIDSFWDYLQGELDPAEASALEQALLADEHAAAVCRDLTETMVLVREAFQSEGAALHELKHLTGPDLLHELARREQLAQPVLVDLSEQSHAYELKSQDTTDPLTFKQIASASAYLLRQYKAKAIAFGSLAAILVLSVALYLVFVDQGTTPGSTEVADHTPSTPPVELDTTSIVATLTAERDAVWSSPQSEGALAPGSDLRSGQRLTLTAGFAEITTNDGAIAILEAPATVELLDNDNALRLHAGKLVGICETESSKGFVVHTPHMVITDLGTRFGVLIDKQEGVRTEVFEGTVAVSPINALGPDPAQFLLQAGESVVMDASSRTFERVEMDTRTFHAVNLLARKVDVLAGEIDFSATPIADPAVNGWPEVYRGAVIYETARPHTLLADLPLTVAGAGRYDRFDPAQGRVAAGTTVRAYTVFHYVPEQRVEDQVSTGSVTFQGDVLGVVSNQQDVAEFAREFGIPHEPVFPGLALSASPLDSAPEGLFDTIELDRDARTVRFDLRTGLKTSDAFLVLVREPAAQRSDN